MNDTNLYTNFHRHFYFVEIENALIIQSTKNAYTQNSRSVLFTATDCYVHYSIKISTIRMRLRPQQFWFDEYSTFFVTYVFSIFITKPRFILASIRLFCCIWFQHVNWIYCKLWTERNSKITKIIRVSNTLKLVTVEQRISVVISKCMNDGVYVFE